LALLLRVAGSRLVVSAMLGAVAGRVGSRSYSSS
jgi:hypothetical protein